MDTGRRSVTDPASTGLRAKANHICPDSSLPPNLKAHATADNMSSEERIGQAEPERWVPCHHRHAHGKPVYVDSVILQTLQDSPGWAQEGALLNYAPNSFDHVNQTFKDSTACWYATLLV
ncbi:uncharacterized protein NFIA_061640 [Aspergillus fischeri NRRL 181]|uniref:Uncharacterized protein n=1 Tax=Neosartorya fischeri (strain ATCC 1020 / DSM 3700 / CBS 544.65 / FGSC A1164 / JCM 1740 / NRRL 181 / WB 181) TaxID=331117 RepID=A1D5K9_NEOFI|nr:uncharacterized protein NFIA_061640 [Aspergillus fischeri NRRL 181]EAW21003.1 hypothetical protein NFIA_061640 [Aspergillus fischeri NRRL 181]